MPTRGRVTIETVTCLSRLDGVAAVMKTVSRQSAADARNALAAMAVQAPNLASFSPRMGWFVLWVDDDAWWRPGTVAQALTTLIQNKESIDVLAGWFCSRTAGASPAVRKRGNTWPRPGADCQFGDIVEIERSGFHFVMHPLSLLEKFTEAPFTIGADDHAEDYAFCRRARDLGARIWVHTGLPVAHIGDDGSAYLPGEPAYRVVDGELLKSEQPTRRTYGFEPQENTELTVSA
jgi:hypothetical protein